MNLFIKYKSDISLDIELLDTPAVKKWVFCFLSNKHLTPMESVRTYWNQGAHNPPNYTPGTKKLLSKKINDAISIINGVIAGQEFPYQAKEEMSIIETQQIHRSFTTGITTGKAWKHGWDYNQLYKFKSMEWPEKRQAFKDLAPKQFEILDLSIFNKQCHIINDCIHSYEPSIFSQRSKDSYDKVQSAAYLYTRYKGGTEGGENWTMLTPTLEELRYSFPGDYAEYDVHMHSHIFGKTYRETYFEYDPAIEFDVTNVENIAGEFLISPPSKDRHEADFRRCVKNSDWSNWLDETNLPFYLTRTPPLGKIVCWSNLSDDYTERQNQLTAEIESIDLQW